MGFFDFLKRKKPVSENKPRERRIVPRWDIKRKSQIKWTGQEDFVDCQILDINLKGFSIVLRAKLPDSPTDFTISFNDKFIINAQAVITWHKESDGVYSYGMKFTRIRDFDKDKIYQMARHDFPQHFEK